MAGSIGVIGGELLSAVGKVAPVLGSVLGSPLAGVALSLIASAFGVSTKDINALTTAVISDPESAVKLRALELEHAETLAKVASSDYQTEVSDRKDARANSAPYRDFLRHMAYLVTFGFFVTLLLMFLPLNVDPHGRELLSMLVGMLVSKWQTIMDFFYGSCHAKPNNHGGLTNGRSNS